MLEQQNMNRELTELVAKQAISEVIFRYCRAIDRRDFDLLKLCYWPDAVDDHAVMRGSVEDFIAYSVPFLEDVVTSHMVTNHLVDLASPVLAYSECYFSALHDLPGQEPGAGRIERTVGGRYVDRFEFRGDADGTWRIAARTVVIDWYREGPSTSVWDHGRYANLPNRGSAKPQDPLYQLNPLSSGPITRTSEA